MKKPISRRQNLTALYILTDWVREYYSTNVFVSWPLSCRQPFCNYSDHSVFGLFMYDVPSEFIFLLPVLLVISKITLTLQAMILASTKEYYKEDIIQIPSF